MATVVKFKTTKAYKQEKEYKHYTKLIDAEKKKQTVLNKQANKLVNGYAENYKKQHKKELTQQQRLAYLKSQTKLYKALQTTKRKERRYRKKRERYDKNKQAYIKAHKANSLINVKKQMHKRNKTYNSYVMPNDARSNSSYVLLMVTNEGDEHSINVATVPVEHGMNMQTATQMNNPTVSITAKIYGDNMHKVKQQVNRLTGWANSGAEMYFSGPHEHPHCTISDVTATYNWGEDGSLTTADISMSLTLANYFGTQKKHKKGAKNHTGSKGRTRGRSSKNKDAQHYIIAKSGTTYAYVAAKKHVSIQSLRDANKYSDRTIPIGAKIYY